MNIKPGITVSAELCEVSACEANMYEAVNVPENRVASCGSPTKIRYMPYLETAIPLVEGTVLAVYRETYWDDECEHVKTPPIIVVDEHEFGVLEVRLDVYEVEPI